MLIRFSLNTILVFLLVFSFNTYSVNFNQYCQYQTAEQDCSAEFMDALLDAANTQESIIFSAGKEYRIDRIDTSGLALDGISLVGEGDSTPVIHTDGLYLFDTGNLLIKNIKITGIHNEAEDTEQGNSLLLLGTRNRLAKIRNITVDNVTFENAAEDLLVLWNTQNVTISNSIFKRSGLAMRVVPSAGDANDLRPRGSGLLFHNVIDLDVGFNEFYQIKKVGIFLDAEDILDENIKIHDNYIDLLSDEKPTQRYGLKGGAGIYLANENNTKHAEIYNNRILNYTMNGMRINGDDVKVFNNAFNYTGQCEEMDTSIAKPLVGMAIKGHLLTNAEITDNCIQNTHSGIVLESWGNIENITIKHNSIYGAKVNFWVDDQEGGVSSNIVITENILADSNGKEESSGGAVNVLFLSILVVVRRYWKLKVSQQS